MADVWIRERRIDPGADILIGRHLLAEIEVAGAGHQWASDGNDGEAKAVAVLVLIIIVFPLAILIVIEVIIIHRHTGGGGRCRRQTKVAAGKIDRHRHQFRGHHMRAVENLAQQVGIGFCHERIPSIAAICLSVTPDFLPFVRDLAGTRGGATTGGV